MTHEGMGVVNGNRTTTDHANGGIFHKGCAEAFNRAFFGNDIGSDQYDYLTGCLFKKEINGRSLALAFFLYTEPDAGLL